MENEKPSISNNNPMSANYRISESDYVCAMKLNAMRTLRGWVVSILIWTVLFLLAAVIGSGIGTVMESGIGAAIASGIGTIFDWHVVIIVVGCGIGYWIAVVLARMYLIIPRKARNSYRRYKLMQENEFELVVLDDGIRLTSSTGESRLQWNKFLKWRCNADYVLIYTAPSLFLVFPGRTLATQGFDIAGFKDLLTRHIGPPK